MYSNANTKQMAECTFDMCSGADWHFHTVQVALANDRMGTLGEHGGAITLQNVIATSEAAAKLVGILSMRRGHCGTPQC